MYLLKTKILDKWNSLEDMKEDKIIREWTRRDNVSHGQVFSFKKFMASQRLMRMKPIEIGSEEDFLKKIEEDQKVYLKNGPRSAIIRKSGHENYLTRRQYEIENPIIYELRRKARVTFLVEQREGAINKRIVELKIKTNKEKRQIERLEGNRKRNEHWDNVYGEWRAKKKSH